MTDTATTGGAIEIAFPRQDSGSTALAIPTAPVTPANATIQAVVTGSSLDDARRVLRCSDLLVGETRQRAEQEAADLLPKMLDNTQVFLAYGTDSLTGVNALIDKLLREVEPTRIAEVTALMHDLNDGMREVKDKYDIADPKVREKFEHWKGGILRFLGHAKSMVEMLMEDVTSVDHQLDKVAEELRGRQYQLMRNVGFYDELYEENEVEIGKVIYAIAVMELIHDLALKQASEIKVGDASLGDRGGEQQAALAEFASNMAIKIAEYKGRLFVAWSTSPQVRTMRTLNVSLAERLNELVCVTIPTMKATIVQWRMLVQTQDAAKLSEQVAAASN